MSKNILVVGAAGQIGTELVMELRKQYGDDHVIAGDIRPASDEIMASGHFAPMDITDRMRLEEIIERHEIDTVFQMAALLSGTAEQKPQYAWHLNMTGLLNVLELAREGKIKHVYWPSSIAVFGHTTPKENTPQLTIAEPSTVYGISKLAGERWCEYYHKKFGVDVRSIRYPGIISWKSKPGGGTTDYAVEIYYDAIEKGAYTSFLNEGTRLPMMYMDDAIRATIELMQAPAARLKIRSSYNLAGISFAPEEVAASIQKWMPEFEMSYDPDFRQAIADSWPSSIDDGPARADWGWKHEYDLDRMTETMLRHLKEKLA